MMQYLSSAPSSILYRSLTVLQKMYRNSSVLEPIEVEIKPHLQSLLDGKIDAATYIEIVKYQDTHQEKIGEKLHKEEEQKGVQEGQKVEKELQNKPLKQGKEQERKEKFHRKKEEEEKARKEQEEQEKLIKHKEEIERKKLEINPKAQVPFFSEKRPESFSSKRVLAIGAILGILLISVIAILNQNSAHGNTSPPISTQPLTAANSSRIAPITSSISAPTTPTPVSTTPRSVSTTPTSVSILKAPVVEEFSADVRNGPAPLKVQFTSKTADNPADYDYYWVFEPSTSSDWNSHHEETAKHTFAEPGNYTVSLTITNNVGNATITMKDYINVTSEGNTSEGKTAEISSALKAPVVEEFSADVRNGPAPLKVQFTSKTAGNPADYDYYWVFESSTSSDWNSQHAETAKHTFVEPGNYTVCLNVTNEVGSYAVSMKDYINVTG